MVVSFAGNSDENYDVSWQASDDREKTENFFGYAYLGKRRLIVFNKLIVDNSTKYVYYEFRFSKFILKLQLDIKYFSCKICVPNIFRV